MRLESLIVLLFGLFAMAGCGGANAGSCKASGGTASYCIEYVGTSFTAATVKSQCTTAKGTYSTGACAAGAPKECVFQKGTATEIRWVFSTADAGTSTQTLCKSAGGSYE
jgi:hypothetical protein